MDSLVVGKVTVPASALKMAAVRASGPGGQNVNKVSSKVELRVDLDLIEGLDYAAFGRLLNIVRNKLDAEGKLLVTSQVTRDQQRNLDDALSKVKGFIEQSLIVPIVRRKTKPHRGAVRARLNDKKKNGERKASRSTRSHEE